MREEGITNIANLPKNEITSKNVHLIESKTKLFKKKNFVY